MAACVGVKKIKQHYFFGFAKFFSPLNKHETLQHPEDDLSNVYAEDDMDYLSPIKINFALNIEKTCVSWSTIFNLCKETGKVHVYGWCNGRKIEEKENILLPVESKICNLQTDWKKLILISDDGKCHVILNVYDDWSSVVCESATKFTACGVGELHTIVIDENNKTYSVKTDNKIIESSKTEKNCESSSCLLLPIPLKVKVDSVSCGKEHVLLLNTTSGHVFSFGLGSRGQLGHGGVNAETSPKIIEALTGLCIKQVAAGGWHSLALSDIGDIYAWGWNNHGQLGITCLPPEVHQAFYMLPYIIEFPQECIVNYIACGARHSGAVTCNPQAVWTWGWGKYGQLGHGNNLDKTTPTLVEYFETIQGLILNISCGPWQTIVTLESNL